MAKLPPTPPPRHPELPTLSLREVHLAELEIERALGADSLPPSPDVDRTSVEDLRKTGAIANDFMRGLDRVNIVLMALVLKFGRATNMMKAVLIGMMVGIVLFTIALLTSYTINSKLEKVIATQETLIRKVDDVAKEAAEASRRAEDARDQAKVAEDAAPKVVYDETTGKPKLVVKTGGTPKKEGSPKKVELDIKLR